jgi:Arc/MetJ-type ribon-helix-helix transcriptional regulator
MSTQIAVRLPDEMVAFIDELVAHGDASSRAAVVTRALDRERRRLLAERDAEIYASITDDPDDLDALAAYASRTPLDID